MISTVEIKVKKHYSNLSRPKHTIDTISSSSDFIFYMLIQEGRITQSIPFLQVERSIFHSTGHEYSGIGAFFSAKRNIEASIMTNLSNWTQVKNPKIAFLILIPHHVCGFSICIAYSPITPTCELFANGSMISS